MAQPYIGEVRLFAGNFAPAGWAFCDGALLPISEYDALFNLIGTTYGGDGQSTFGLPDMRGRIPIHQGGGFILAQIGGVEQVTLTVQQIPNHTHVLTASSSAASTANVANALPAVGTLSELYSGEAPDALLSPQAVAPIGGNQPHTNMQPYLCVNFIISLFGIFPSPT
jgi:microcystin-dependent protein